MNMKLNAAGEQITGKANDHVTVLDEKTDLEWAVNVPELQGNFFTHEEAGKAVAALNHAGHNDWRFPTPHELFGLVSYENGDVLTNKDLFPDTLTDDWYWTSQVTPWSTSYAFAVSFDGGCVGGCYRGSECFVRPVRVARQ